MEPTTTFWTVARKAGSPAGRLDWPFPLGPCPKCLDQGTVPGRPGAVRADAFLERASASPSLVRILPGLAARAPGARLTRPGDDTGTLLCISGAFLHNGGCLLGTRPAEIVGPTSGGRCRLAAEKARIGRRGACRSKQRVAFDGRRLGQWDHRPRNRPFIGLDGRSVGWAGSPRQNSSARCYVPPRCCIRSVNA